MFDERKVCEARFNQLADEFAKGLSAALLEEAGDLLAKAYRCGFVVLPGLAELVERAEDRRQHEDAEAAAKVGLPMPGAQLFEDFAGFNEWPVQLIADDKEIAVKDMIATGDAVGGVAESQFFSGPKKEQTKLERGAAILSSSFALL